MPSTHNLFGNKFDKVHFSYFITASIFLRMKSAHVDRMLPNGRANHTHRICLQINVQSHDYIQDKNASVPRA